MKDRELRKRLQTLERDRRFGGWRGGGGRSLDGLLPYRCWSDDSGYALSLHKRGEWTDVGYINEDMPCNILKEGRIYCAFGDDGNGDSLAMKWEWETIMLMGRLYSSLFGGAHVKTAFALESRGAYLPTIIAAYPILDKWTLPAVVGQNLLWANKPRTTFDDNITGGSTCGHINPATNNFDNYLAHCQVGNLIDEPVPLDYALPAQLKNDTILGYQAYIGADAKSYMGYDGAVGFNSTAAAFGGEIDDMNTGCKMVFMRMGAIPNDPIYGVAFMIMTLDDLQLWRLSGGYSDINTSFFLCPNWSLMPHWYLYQNFNFATEFGFLQRASWYPSIATNPEHELIFTTDEMPNSSEGVPKHNIGLNPNGQKILAINLV